MKIFNDGNWSGDSVCLVCNTKDKGKVTLIGVVGTEEDHIIEGKQVHIDCLNLFYYPKYKLITQKL